jgi:hypothetical protein
MKTITDPWAAEAAEATWPDAPMAEGSPEVPADPAAAFPEPPPTSWQTPDGHTEYDGEGTIYLLHLDPPIIPYEGAPDRFCAFHYRGHAEPGRLDARLREEASGKSQAAKIMQHQINSGGGFRVTKTEPGGYERERALKDHGASKDCPEPECQARWAAEYERHLARNRERKAEYRTERGWESAAAEGLAANAKPERDAASWSPGLEAEAG